MAKPTQSTFRALPSVERLLSARPLRTAAGRWGRSLVVELVRRDLEALRKEIAAGTLSGERARRRAAAAAVARRVEAAAGDLLRPRPRRVLNATGVVVHTNLGRAALSAAAAESVARAARGYLDLEYDLGEGRRGSRHEHLAPLLGRLFPGAAAFAVNNNAAATMLALRALARRKEVVVSRGELVEIGGSFRVPDILRASGAKLREVGTTNRTRLADYRAACGDRTGLLLKVHTSNFKVVGFAEETSVAELAGLARESGVPLLVDWGSGDLVDLGPLGIADERPVRALLDDGADLVTFSGDKLLGGPQAGFVVGRPDLVERCRRDPLARVCRLDRLRIGALHATLAAYVRGAEREEIPTLRMLALSAASIGRRARRVAAALPEAPIDLIDGESRTGGGSSPTGARPTKLLAVTPPRGAGGASALARALREGEPPVVARVADGRVLLDLRTVEPDEDAELGRALAAALARLRG